MSIADARDAYDTFKEEGVPAILQWLIEIPDPTPDDPTKTKKVPKTWPTYALPGAGSVKALGFVFGEAMVRVGDMSVSIACFGMPVEPVGGDRLIFLGRIYVIKSALPPTFSGPDKVTQNFLVQ